MDIFGTGRLEDQIKAEIAASGLEQLVSFNGVLDFETELVPFMRSNCDIYLSCHRQSDPSCTFLETMGCGLAVVGYANEMWSNLNKASGAGWTVPMASVPLLARTIAEADKHRAPLADRMRKARQFAAEHCFEVEFSKRVQHLRDTLDASPAHGH
jgi:glycosyltransferase involved in cell wall biosynthesis